MKNLVPVLLLGLTVFSVMAADKLPAYNTPEWHALPGMKELRTAAEKGDADAQYLLACAIDHGCTRAGKLVETYEMEWEFKARAQELSIFKSPLNGRDPKKVFAIYRNFAEKGCYIAQRVFAEILMKINKQDAMIWFRKAAEQGDDVSQYNVGKAYGEGVFGEPNWEMTLKYWELSAAQGNHGALKDLGILWLDGFNDKKDIAKAIKYFKLAVEKGDTPAAYILGDIYSNGLHGIPVDKDLAIKYFREAAEKEKNVAIQIKRTADLHFRLAMSHALKNDVVQQNKLLQSAANAGHQQARITILRNKFRSGNEREKTEVLKEITLLAEKGNSKAQLNLAFFLFILKRHEEGTLWYCRALGNREFTAFIVAPNILFNTKFTDRQKQFLKGVFLLADHVDDSDMQYVAMHLLETKQIPGDKEKVYKYHDLLLKKSYPRILLPYLCLTLQEQGKQLSDAEKTDIALQIEKLAEHLRGLAVRGDNEAADILEEFSSFSKSNK